MPWEDVAERWNEMSGETITTNRVWQIGRLAENKLRRQLADLADYEPPEAELAGPFTEELL